jgi:hypothetical protein
VTTRVFGEPPGPPGLLGQAAAWCEGRVWWWRAVLLLALGWDGLRHFRDPDAGGLFAGITFGVHEFGHLFFAFAGEFMGVLGGSLMQLLIPIGTGWLMYYYDDYFGIAGAGAWLSSSLFDLARYIGDARALELDLVGFGDNPQHDWAWLLGRMGALSQDTRIAGLTRFLGVAVLVGSLWFGGWLCLRMRAARPAS